MQKIINAITIFSLLFSSSLILPAPISANDLGDYEATLYAGQDMEVGGVQIWNDTNNLYVKYVIDAEGWCLTETHLEANTSLEDFPFTKGKGKVKNVIPGKFEYSQTHECETDYTYTIPLEDWENETELYVSAHAVVKNSNNICENSAILYGIQRYSGDVYGINVLDGSSWLEFEMPDPPGADRASPNGLAYDSENGFMYYTDYQLGNTPDMLYFWDGEDQYVAGELVGTVAAADFYDGKYYYIPHNTDHLYEATFNNDGTLESKQKIAEIAGGSNKWTFNGDIAVKDEIIYGWGKSAISGKFEYFTYSISDGKYTNTIEQNDFQQSLQLSFGSNGILYGHRSGNGGYFYTVEEESGNVELVEPTPDPGNLYTDTASGKICETETGTKTETAWAGETRFNDKGNWARYFTYTVSGYGEQYELIETLQVPADNDAGVDSADALESGESYLIKVSGTYRFVNWSGENPENGEEYGLADAEYSNRISSYAPGGDAGWTKG